MKLVFLDKAVLFTWVLHRVSKTKKRQLTSKAGAVMDNLARIVETYEHEGMRPACTIDSACAVITKLYKDPSLPFAGKYKGFQVRKSFAREAAVFVRRETTLLFPVESHFEAGERLWFLYCDQGSKEQYGQFSDYVDAALIIDPPSGQSISTALLGHTHVLYVLRKVKSEVLPQIIDKTVS